MRQIKFRAWDKGNECFVGKNWHLNFSDNCIIFDNGDTHRIKDAFELMQFTGLLDKNGKEIYESDLYKFINSNGDERISEIPRIDKFFHFYYEHVIVPENIEIVGDIYSSPELLS